MLLILDQLAKKLVEGDNTITDDERNTMVALLTKFDERHTEQVQILNSSLPAEEKLKQLRNTV